MGKKSDRPKKERIKNEKESESIIIQPTNKMDDDGSIISLDP